MSRIGANCDLFATMLSIIYMSFHDGKFDIRHTRVVTNAERVTGSLGPAPVYPENYVEDPKLVGRTSVPKSRA